MFETPQECILDTLEPLQSSKKRICSKFGFFRVFHTPDLGPDLVILSPFWGNKFQNPCKKCPNHGEKFLKIFLFFKNVPNSPRKHFGQPKPIINHQKPMNMKNMGFSD